MAATLRRPYEHEIRVLPDYGLGCDRRGIPSLFTKCGVSNRAISTGANGRIPKSADNIRSDPDRADGISNSADRESRAPIVRNDFASGVHIGFGNLEATREQRDPPFASRRRDFCPCRDFCH